MAGTLSKSISLTDKATGTTFKLQASALILFYAVNSGTDSSVTYVDPATGFVVTRTVDEVVATINTAAAKTFTVTTTDGDVIYIHADRVVYVSDLTDYRQISYFNEKSPVLQLINVTDTSSAINTAAGNTLTVTMSDGSGAILVNNNLIADIASSSAVRQAILEVLLKAESAVVVTAGTGYAPGNTITIAGGTKSIATILNVATTKVVSATVAAGGTGGTDGTRTVTGTTGTGTKFQASVTVSGGAITAVLSISVAGSYTVNPTAITAEPVTGASLTGATLSVVMGVETATINTAGSYSATPSNPVSQDTTSGSGTGATFTNLYEFAAITVVDGGLNYSIAPTITTGGDGSAATATATIVNGSLNHVTVTDAGGSYTYATATASAGSGAIIMYDDKNATLKPLHVSETPAALQTAINAL